jgi:predicted dithiol-disulfide oxidoreductase (DUF899 family)
MTKHMIGTWKEWLAARLEVYQWLDRAPAGRNEERLWWRRHDESGNR